MVSKILVTGASGDLGRKTVLHLLERRPAGELVGVARDPSKAADLTAKGVEIRQGDYFEPSSLSQAFKGVEADAHLNARVHRPQDRTGECYRRGCECGRSAPRIDVDYSQARIDIDDAGNHGRR
jgi:uncharacterized protein YbjT (DUF2867 family)